jgi:hypothetical protein
LNGLSRETDNCSADVAYYRGAMGIMIVYDVTNEQSFQNIRYWIRKTEQQGNLFVCFHISSSQFFYFFCSRFLGSYEQLRMALTSF